MTKVDVEDVLEKVGDWFFMKENGIQEILNYYLEYEIYNIATSSELEIKGKTSMIFKDILDESAISEALSELTKIKLREKIEKFMGKKQNNLPQLVDLIYQELNDLEAGQANQGQVSFRIVNLIKENLTYKREERILENFAKELCDIKDSREFWLYAHNISMNYKMLKKLPIFIFRCKIKNERIEVIEANVNVETLNHILALKLKRELADVVLEYKEVLESYCKEIQKTIDVGDIEHLLALYYLKLEEYIEISKETLEEIVRENERYYMNEEYIISLDELVKDGIKNIKEDIELLNKVIAKEEEVPKVLNQYLNGSLEKKDMNHPKYAQMYRGNYKNDFGVGVNQYKIVNTLKDNELIAVEGPPGTGKTSLLKEIVANKVVERADLILKNWDEKFEANRYGGTIYYDIGWYKKDERTIKSIVVSSKNGEAIENVGREVNKEICYMFPVARRYKRVEQIDKRKVKVLQGYKGVVCLPLGNKENIKDFKDFLYQDFIPFLEKLGEKQGKEESIEKIKENYANQCEKVAAYERLLVLLGQIKERKKYFYGIEEFIEKETKNEKIQKIFAEDKEKKRALLMENKRESKNLIQQKVKEEEKLRVLQKGIEKKEEEIENCQQTIVKGRNKLDALKKQEEYFRKISRNILTKLLNFREYRKNKKINFEGQMNEITVANEIEKKKIDQYLKDRSDLEKQKDESDGVCGRIVEKYNGLRQEAVKLEESLKEMEWIEKFNQLNEETTYWDYTSMLEIYGKSSFNKLNQELFALALKLNEAYIIKNAREIVQNLRLFLTGDENSFYICQKFYDSAEVYNRKKQEGIRAFGIHCFCVFQL